MPARHFSSVLFPDPLRPTTAKNSPGATENETWSTAVSSCCGIVRERMERALLERHHALPRDPEALAHVVDDDRGRRGRRSCSRYGSGGLGRDARSVALLAETPEWPEQIAERGPVAYGRRRAAARGTRPCAPASGTPSARARAPRSRCPSRRRRPEPRRRAASRDRADPGGGSRRIAPQGGRHERRRLLPRWPRSRRLERVGSEKCR